VDPSPDNRPLGAPRNQTPTAADGVQVGVRLGASGGRAAGLGSTAWVPRQTALGRRQMQKH